MQRLRNFACLQSRFWNTQAAAVDLGVELSQAHLGANVPDPLLQQLNSFDLETVPVQQPLENLAILLSRNPCDQLG